MASFFRRFFSRRKKLPDNVEPKKEGDKDEKSEKGKLKSKDIIQCNIILLDNETLTFDLPVFSLNIMI